MAVYHAEYIPRWVWVLLVVAGLLLVLLAFSLAVAGGSAETVVVGSQVQTGNPADYVQTAPPQPSGTLPPAETVTPGTETPGQPSAPSGGQPGGTTPTAPSGNVPAGLPQTFTYGGQTYQYSSGPVKVNVLTTGQHTSSGQIIYHRSGDNAPYKALYIESAPNSGQFYRYVPAPTTTG